MSLGVLIRRYKWFHKPISLFFQYIVYPLGNGYYLFMLKYIFIIKRNEIVELQKYGFTKIIPFNSRTWRIGKERDKAYRRYYSAYFKDKKCFIKVAQNDSTIGNEITVAEQLLGKKLDYISEVITFDKKFASNMQMLATAFTDGLHPISKESIYNDVEQVSSSQLIRYCKQMYKILLSLEDLQLVHADIHKGNLMLDSNDNLILLDFGISKFLDKENEVKYDCRPGTFFRQTPEGRVYDDAYSFLQLINRYESCRNIHDTEAYKSICARVNKVKFLVII